MYKNKGKQREANREANKRYRLKQRDTVIPMAKNVIPMANVIPLNKGVTPSTVTVTPTITDVLAPALSLQTPLPGTRQGMRHLKATRYDPRKVTLALAGYKQPSHWGIAP